MHTPGPWEAYNGEVTTLQESGRSYRRIASVHDYGMAGSETDTANAVLIAAAPDLLDALKNAVDEMAHTLVYHKMTKTAREDKRKALAYWESVIKKGEGR